jgi:tRNA threonylcarbamoyl adenosine modification protein YeaZ
VLVLALDTSTPAVTAALTEVAPEGVVALLAERVSVDARRHGELLSPSIEAVLTESGRTPGQLGAIAVGLGPGPFTGLRVGLVTAAALADSLSLPVYGECSLDAVAAQVPPGRPLLVATDARRREVYWAGYDSDRRRIAGPAVAAPADLPYADYPLRAGAGLALYADQLGIEVLSQPRYPGGVALAGLVADRALAGAPADPLTPLYLRRPDAAEPGPRKPVLR